MVAPKAAGLLVLSVLIANGCVFRTVSITQVGNPIPDSAAFASPLKLQLRDGSLVVFPQGASLQGDTLRGRGMRYPIALTDSTPVTAILRDSIVSAVHYRTRVNAAATTFANLLILPVLVYGGYIVAYVIACSNSCYE
jgi:hypothetical protein